MAFFAALRHIYLEEPYGESGFFTRLAHLRSRALYIYGRGDVLITPHFAKKIGSVLPAARVELWDDCGHAPQLEHPDKTARTLIDFFSGSRLLYGSTSRGRAV
jgi:pimeloyl-ACP methyl ester carboxylesterase